MKRPGRILLALGWVLMALVAVAPATARAAEEGWQAYTRDDVVNDVALEGGGALSGGITWVATTGGVLCCDGSAQVKFTMGDGLLRNNVSAIAVDGGGRLWFGAEWGGVSVLEHGGTPLDKGDDRWMTFTTGDGLVDARVRAVALDGAGRVWFGTWEGVSVLDYNGTPFDKGDDTWVSFTESRGLEHNLINSVAVDGGGRLWFGGGLGVSVLDHGGTLAQTGDDAWITFSWRYGDGIHSDGIHAIVEDPAGWMWFGTSSGASVLDHGGTPFDRGDDTWENFSYGTEPVGEFVYAAARDAAGRLWFGSGYNGLSVLDHGGTPFDKGDDTWNTFNTPDGMTSYLVHGLAVGAGGRVWVGTELGLDLLDHGGTPFDKGDDTWTAIPGPDGLPYDRVNGVAVDGAGRVWFATETAIYNSEGAASVLDHGGTTFDKGDDTWGSFEASGEKFAVAVDSATHVWIGGYSVRVLDHGGTPFDTGDDSWGTIASGGHRVSTVVLDAEPWVWFGTWGGGVTVVDHGGTPTSTGDDSRVTFTTTDGLADDTVMVVAVDGGGRLWFGTWGGGVSVLDHGGTPLVKGDDTWAALTTTDGLAHDQVTAVAVDGAGRLWFGTSGGGVSVLDYGSTPFDDAGDTWTTFTSADGLADDGVAALAIDGGGRLWFGTGGGVSVLDDGGTPFDRADDAWTTYTSGDGLNGYGAAAIAVDPSGRRWFGASGVAELVDTVAPSSSAGSPEVARDTVSVSWSAGDGGSGVFGATLWAKHGSDGTWASTGLSQTGGSGVFEYTPGLGDGTYYLATVAEDWLGNIEPEPMGAGDDSTVYDTLAPTAAASAPAETSERSFVVSWTGADATSGVASYDVQYRLGSDGTWQNWQSATTQTSATFGPSDPAGVQFDETYYFRARARDHAGNVGAYAPAGDCSTHIGYAYVYLPLLLRAGDPWDAYYEENDHWLDAYGPLASGQVYQAYPDDEDDYYYLELATPATVHVTVTGFAPTSSNGDLLLYGPATGDERGTLITYFGQTGQTTMSLSWALGAGKYYVRVYTANQHSTTELYALTVTY